MIRKIIQIVYAILFFCTPLILSSSTSEMFEIPKMLLIYIASVVIVTLYIIDYIWNAREVHISKIQLLVFIFIIFQIISYLFSIDTHTSFFGYYGRFNGGLLSSFAFASLFFVATQVLDELRFRQIFVVSVIASMIVLLWGLPGRFFGVDTACIYFRGEFSNDCWTNEFRPAERMFSTLGQPNWLGTYFAAHVMIGIYLLLSKFAGAKVKPKRIATVTFSEATIIAYIAAMFVGVLLTGSRSSLISVFVPLGIESFIWLSKKVSHTVIKASVLLIVTATIIISAQYAQNLVKDTGSGITHSGKIRLIVWEGAVRLWAKYPVFGTGPETFAYSYYLTRPKAHNYTSEKEFVYNKAHNEFLNMLATTGTVGFTTYFVVILFAIYLLLKSSIQARIISYAIISICVSNFFGFSTSTSQLLLYIFFAYAAISDSANLSINGAKLLRFRVVKASLCILVITFFALSVTFFRNYFLADVTYAMSQSAYESGDPANAIRLCHRAYESKFEHIYADRCASIAASTASLLATAEDEDLVELQKSYIKIANAFGAIALNSSPRNPLYLKSRARVIGVLMSVDATNKKKYEAELHDIASRFKLLAPTDHTKL